MEPTPMKPPTPEQVLEAITANPGRTSREIAEAHDWDMQRVRGRITSLQADDKIHRPREQSTTAANRYYPGPPKCSRTGCTNAATNRGRHALCSACEARKQADQRAEWDRSARIRRESEQREADEKRKREEEKAARRDAAVLATLPSTEGDIGCSTCIYAGPGLTVHSVCRRYPEHSGCVGWCGEWHGRGEAGFLAAKPVNTHEVKVTRAKSRDDEASGEGSGRPPPGHRPPELRALEAAP